MENFVGERENFETLAARTVRNILEHLRAQVIQSEKRLAEPGAATEIADASRGQQNDPRNGAMARPVLQAYTQATAEVNRGNAWFGRVAFPQRMREVQRQLAGFLGVGEDEVVLTRGATEALQALIGGYNRLRPGDQVLYADIDYDSTITAMRWLRARRGVEPVAIALPEPCGHAQVLEAYTQALQRNPRLKLMLLTQVNHRNGMLLPVEHRGL